MSLRSDSSGGVHLVFLRQDLLLAWDSINWPARESQGSLAFIPRDLVHATMLGFPRGFWGWNFNPRVCV